MLSKKLEITLNDLLEEAEKQEKQLRKKDEEIQKIVSRIESALKCNEMELVDVLFTIVEEYKEAI